jgi:hypothetical protein
LNIDPKLRDEVKRLTGARTMKDAIQEALADLVLREQVVGPLTRRREMEREWVAKRGYGLPRTEPGKSE